MTFLDALKEDLHKQGLKVVPIELTDELYKMREYILVLDRKQSNNLRRIDELEHRFSQCNNEAKAVHAENLRLEALLSRGLERMKLINGPESKCYLNPESCANHMLIRDIEAYFEKGKL